MWMVLEACIQDSTPKVAGSGLKVRLPVGKPSHNEEQLSVRERLENINGLTGGHATSGSSRTGRQRLHSCCTRTLRPNCLAQWAEKMPEAAAAMYRDETMSCRIWLSYLHVTAY